MKRVIAALLITMLCACSFLKLSENDAYRKGAYNKWVGRPLDELLVEYGEPINIYSLEKGTRTFEYWEPEASTQSTKPGETARIEQVEQAEQTMHSGSCDNKALARIETTEESWPVPVLVAGTNPCEPQGPAWRKRPGKKSNQSLGCMILFKVSAADIVEGWSVDCRKQD